MKKILYIAIFALAAFAGCQKDKQPSLADKISGEWRGSELTVEAAIYISFASDGTFELYQKLETEGFEVRRGKWTLAGDVLSGIYNDGEAWAATYKVTITDSTLTMTDTAETNIYQKTEIPAEIKKNSTVVVKSGTL